MKQKIASMAPLPVELLRHMVKSAGYPEFEEIDLADVSTLSGNELSAQLKDADIIIGDFTFKKRITRDVVNTLKKARFIQQPSVGYQHIDIAACTEAGIMVANTAGANTIGVAEHTVMAGLALIKKLMYAHKSTMGREWKQLEIGPAEIFGKTWGIIGMGQIGKAVALRLRPFGVNCIYYDIRPLDQVDEKQYQVSYRDLETLVTSADVISLHCPLTPETEGLIGEKELSQMKTGAVLINVSRGEVIDEKSLARALAEKKVAGAALDVFILEPISGDNPLLDLASENLIITPHIAGATNESKMRIMGMAIKNIVRVLSGEKPESLVNNIDSGGA